MATYDFQPIAAGRRFGPHPCRDPSNTDFAYHIRERDGATHYDGVKVNLRTGAQTVLQSWAQASNYDDLGACFADASFGISSQTNLATSLTGSKLYLFAYTGSGASADNRIVELNKSDMSVSKFFASSSAEPQRAKGVVACNADGTIVARVGSADYTFGSPNVFNGSIIELYRPADDAYGFVNVSTLLGVNGYIGLPFIPSAPIAFDVNGFLWTIDQPWASGSGSRPDYQTAASSLRKLQVEDLGGGVLSLSLVDTYAIADNFYAFAPGVSGPLTFAESLTYRRFVCNHATNRLYFWLAWRPSGQDDTEGWFFEVNATSGAFVRGPLDWSGTVRQTQSQKQDNAGGYHCDDTLATWLEKSSTPATACLNLFDIPTGTERQFTMSLFPNDPYNYPVLATDISLFHCSGSDFVYAFDAAEDFPDYEDALFSIIEAECPTAEDCPPCEVDTEPCGETVEQACLAEWPLTVLQPRSVGVFLVPANIGGGPAMAGGHEEVAATANGFWRFTYADIPIHDRDQILKIRELEVLLEGKAGVICIHAYEGKRAPWLTVGDQIIASAASAFAVGATSGSIQMTSGGVPQPGMFFSWEDTTSGSIAGPHLYCLETVGPVSSGDTYAVTFQPPIRTAIAINDPLEFDHPICRARLADDRGLSVELNLHEHASHTVDFEEDKP